MAAFQKKTLGHSRRLKRLQIPHIALCWADFLKNRKYPRGSAPITLIGNCRVLYQSEGVARTGYSVPVRGALGAGLCTGTC